MLIVSNEKYNKDKSKFFESHDYDYQLETSLIDNDRYVKTYTFADGAIFAEVNEAVYEDAIAVLHGVEFNVRVKMFRTEYFTTDNSQSRYVYSKF